MKKIAFTLAIAAIVLSGCAMGGHGMGMRSGQGMAATMDTNGDGMLSKDEFMKGHELMFDRMKGPNGMISLKDMPRH